MLDNEAVTKFDPDPIQLDRSEVKSVEACFGGSAQGVMGVVIPGIDRTGRLQKRGITVCHRKGLVPGERIELPTNGLQNRCSTAELTRQSVTVRRPILA
jgi:hypothetical protein